MSGRNLHCAGSDVVIDTPSASDGPKMWRIARESEQLDLNSSYAYLLWCRDFAGTSAVARADGDVVGFVIGYVRPQAAETLVAWQIAVHAAHRGRRIATALLHDVVRRASGAGVIYLETTITSDNEASIGLFGALAARWGASVQRSQLFHSAQFPDEHGTEELFRIGPFAPAHAPVSASAHTRRHRDIIGDLTGGF
jgi:L-2,4-diaminobutyric acid acetyltransferase